MSSPAERLRTAFDLHEAGVQMIRLTLRRKHPEETEEQLQARFMVWLIGPPLEIPDHREVSWPRS